MSQPERQAEAAPRRLWAKRGLEAVSVVLLLGLIAVTGIDVIGRKLLNAPFAAAYELTQLMLAALVFVALPLVSRGGEHVEVDLLATLVPEKARRVMGMFAALVSAGCLGFIAWRLVLLGRDHMETGAHSISLEVSYAPFAFLGVVCCVMAAIWGILRETHPHALHQAHPTMGESE